MNKKSQDKMLDFVIWVLLYIGCGLLMTSIALVLYYALTGGR